MPTSSKLSSKGANYLAPFITMVILFFFVGFLTTVNGQFQGPLKFAFLHEVQNMKNTFVTLITFSWFIAYPLTGGLAASWVNKYGYKSTLIRALIILITGLSVFWFSSWFTVHFPSAKVSLGEAVVPYGFFIFLVGSFVVGMAATALQVVINPYVVACQVKGTQAVQRMNIGGTSNSFGTMLAPFFVTGIVFGGLSMEEVTIDQLQTPFIGLIVVIVILTLVLLRLSLPEINSTKAAEGEKLEKSVWTFSHLKLGVIAIFFYVGIEICIGANINLYAIELEERGKVFSFLGFDKIRFLGMSFTIPALMASIYWGGLMIGRFVSSMLSTVAPQHQLAFCAIMAFVFCVLAILVNNPWFLAAIGLFHSVMWGAIFTLATDKLGKYTSVASGALMIGVLGGALLPLFQGFFADAFHGEWRWTWLIVILGELYVLLYALKGYKVRSCDLK